MVPSWSCALFLVFRVRLLRSIVKCVAITSLGYPSSTKWIGATRFIDTILKYRVISPRPGANPWRVIGQIRSKLKIAAAAVQVPIGVEDGLKGVVDLVRWKAIYNEGEKGYLFWLLPLALSLTHTSV